jgi:predicted 3-demethylubiquinone-9 3-methyltransferase (glyoxalase superfamily)
MSQRTRISTFVWFDSGAEEAARLYASIFEGARILDKARAGEKVTSVTFELSGRSTSVFNGMPHCRFRSRSRALGAGREGDDGHAKARYRGP